MYNCFYAKEVFYASGNPRGEAEQLIFDKMLFYMTISFISLSLVYNFLHTIYGSFFFILSAINQAPQGSGHGIKPVGVQEASGWCF